MILNGHISCTTNQLFRFVFRQLSHSVGSSQNRKYARSLTKHVWTFDDALTDQLGPIYLDYFEKEKVTFQFFVCPKLVDEWEMGNIEYVRQQLQNPNAEMLSWEDIGRLVEAGNIIGSHGVDHTSFSGLSIDEAVEQFESSKEMISARTGKVADSFAFPFGYVKPSSIDAALLAREHFSEVYLSDNAMTIGELGDGVFHRRHAEFGLCAARGIVVGALNVVLGIKKWRS
jgi:peptidoglycan/xylan/chitin deacetylase (PgdA/CDA1 family)